MLRKRQSFIYSECNSKKIINPWTVYNRFPYVIRKWDRSERQLHFVVKITWFLDESVKMVSGKSSFTYRVVVVDKIEET